MMRKSTHVGGVFGRGSGGGGGGGGGGGLSVGGKAPLLAAW